MVPPTLSIRLLGHFSLVSGTERVESVTTARLQSLMAYLVLNRDAPQLRQHVAYQFWPESSEAQARNNLRQMVHMLRLALPSADAFLSATTNTLHWRLAAPFHLDVDEFEQALARAEAAPDESAAIHALEQAVKLYQADLLPSCYDDWIAPERERLRQRHTQALNDLITRLEARREYTQASSYAQRLVRFDALNEEAYRTLMRLLTLAGDRAGAVRAYHTCATILQRELGIDPSPATYEAYERLLHTDPQSVSAPDTPPAAMERRPALTHAPSLIGRQREWEQVQDAWRRASTAGPGFALITGEAGIGKSRLTEDLLRWADQQAISTAETRSYAAEGQLSLAPVAEWLRSDGVRPHLAGLDAVWLAEVARILPELLSEHPQLPQVEPITEYGQRQRFFQALALAIFAAPQPLMLLIDDLQWCDKETLEWLHFLLRSAAGTRLLIVGSARTEDMAAHEALQALLLDLRTTIGVTEIALQRLDAAETAELAARLAGRPLNVATAMRLYRETEGNPLFVVETVRAGLHRLRASEQRTEGGAGSQTADTSPALPPKVQAVIAGRLAQLSASAREMVALAAAIGREFSLELLARAAGTAEERIVPTLDELWRRRVIREQGAASYDFTHDKLREVAYAQISTPQRRLLHRRIAEALETIAADELDVVSGQIAAHYERASLSERAIAYYERAAAASQRLYANEDAIGSLSRALALLEQTPAGAARDVLELRLLLALAPIYRITRGWTAPELERLVYRSLVVCDVVGDDTQRVKALHGLQSLLMVQAQLEKIQPVADELQALYQRMEGDAPPLSRMMMVGAQMHLGRIVAANEAFEQILTAHATTHSRDLEESQGWNYAIHTRAWQSHVLWLLGYPAQAQARGRSALRLASDLAQPFNQALAATYFAMLQQFCADGATAKAQAEEALAFSIEYQAPYYQSWSAILMTYGLAREQPNAANISRLRACIAELKASGARLRLPYYFWLLAQVTAQAGDNAEGLAALDEALAESRANMECWWDAELHRLRGELLLASGRDAADVEPLFLQAIATAREQCAKSLELRATLSLARLWRARPRAADGRRRLSKALSWFTEGLDTSDLQEARLLLTQWD